MKLKCDEPLSKVDFNFNVRRYIEGNAKYFFALYGVTDQEADGATISLVGDGPVDPMKPTLKAPEYLAHETKV